MSDKDATTGPVQQSTEKTGGITGAGASDASAALTKNTTIVVGGASGDLAKKKVRQTDPVNPLYHPRAPLDAWRASTSLETAGHDAAESTEANRLRDAA